MLYCVVSMCQCYEHGLRHCWCDKILKVLGKFHQPSIIFSSKVEAYLDEGAVKALTKDKNKNVSI
jgi:hypothetical protein